MATALVTGGSGFIGIHLVERLLELGYRVRVFDNLSTGRRENLRAVLDHVEFLEGDLRDGDAVQRAMQGVDLVFHQGALASVPRSINDPFTSNAVNVDGTLQVLIAARDAGAQRVVVASSSSIYGDSPTLPKMEAMTPKPLSPYAISKLATEQYAVVFASLYELETVALRYFNVFGPRQDPSSPYSGVIALFCTAALEGRPYTVQGDGLQSRDFTYVDNVVDANLRAATTPGVSGEVFNIACGTQITLLDLIAAINQLIGRENPVVYGPDRPGDIRHSLADVEKAVRILGFKPAVTFEQGMARTLEWYRDKG